MSRLIDADKLKNVSIFNGDYDKENADPNFIAGIETVMEYIEEMPTIKLKKGEWVDSPNIMECVICSECASDNLRKQQIAPCTYNFCPNCGADMREEE